MNKFAMVESPVGCAKLVAPEHPPLDEITHAFLAQLAPDSHTSTAYSEVLDRSTHALLARFTGGLSPTALIGAYSDWLAHLASSPGKRWNLAEKSARKWQRLLEQSLRSVQAQDGATTACIEPLPQDKRFSAEAWQSWPYNLVYQSFLLQQQWWHNATNGVRGVSRRHEDMVSFCARQILDMVSPSNFVATNPELLRRTLDEGGANLLRGLQNLTEDWGRKLSGRPPVGTERFTVGQQVAITPGKVVYRNRLIELIQYAPSTPDVCAEPILIVPAWIMKYYILDLSPHNSLVRYLVDHGHTVFMISWKNPDPSDRELGMEDYRKLGVLDALDAIARIVPDRRVHATGYCLGGTLLAIAAAALARDGESRLASMTLLAAQTDFTEAGELMLFINESQIAFLEDLMWEQGFLDSSQMAGTFQMLHSNDLIWSRMVRDYLMGERRPASDLSSWNADATRLPYRMHSEYLRELFLENRLAEGNHVVGGSPVSLSDIRVPIFAVGTERDHVAPWRSVYKIHLLSDTEVTFLLTSGGHNAGIVQEKSGDRHYRISARSHDERHVGPDAWISETPTRSGSWWPEWLEWLNAHSSRESTPPPTLGCPALGKLLGDAPGAYVFMR
jgi:polyhydroxyalkanoate synthase subunit PhaC